MRSSHWFYLSLLLVLGCRPVAESEPKPVAPQAAPPSTGNVSKATSAATAESKEVAQVQPSVDPNKSPQKAPTVAVLDLGSRGSTPELAVLSQALTEMLTNDLAAVGGLHVVDRLRVNQFLRTSKSQASEFAEPSASLRAGKAFAADYLIVGACEGKEPAVSVTMSLIKAGEARPIAEWKDSAPVDKLFDLEGRLSTTILASLGITKPAARPDPPALAGPPPKVAVMALRNLSPSKRYQDMELGFADLLQMNLSALKEAKLVERGNIFNVLKAKELALTSIADPPTAVKVGQLLGAARIIYGSFVELDGRIRFDVCVADPETASIVRAESVTGPTREFATMIEDLALRLAGNLVANADADAAQLMRRLTPTRDIDVALQYANADLAFDLGKFDEAAESFEGVLKLEPTNVRAALKQVESRINFKDFERAVTAGVQVLDSEFSDQQLPQKEQAYFLLHQAYCGAHRFKEAVELNDRLLAELPKSAYVERNRLNLALGLLYLNHSEVDVSQLEETIKNGERQGALPYLVALHTIQKYQYYHALHLTRTPDYRTQRQDPEFRKRITEETKIAAQTCLDLYSLILDKSAGRNDEEVRGWAQAWFCVGRGKDAAFIDDDGVFQTVLNDEEQEALLRRAVNVFSWDPAAAYRGQRALEILDRKLGKWEQAVEANRYLVEHPRGEGRDSMPAINDFLRQGSITWHDNLIDAKCRIATILQEHLNKPQEALEMYQAMVRDYGLLHLRSYSVVTGLHTLGAEASFPENAALVWGGGGETVQAWADELGPFKYTVHRVGEYEISGAQLAPYSLIILVRTGRLPYSPDQIFALRNFVASGGSLLIVVSPGWDRAAPGIHNPLLSFFDAHADEQMTVRADANVFAPHQITVGYEHMLAKNSIALTVKKEASIIEADGKTVLALMPYGEGRVGITSLAQWFHPERGFPLEYASRRAFDGTNVEPADRPIEIGNGLEIGMLARTIEWLVQPFQKEPGKVEHRRKLNSHLSMSLKNQFRVASREELIGAMDQMVASAESDAAREEALWAAGEATLRWFYFGGDVGGTEYGWPILRGEDMPLPESRYYEQLLKQFPNSPMSGYAAWRLAECERLIWWGRHQLPQSSDPGEAHRIKALELFNKISAEPGTNLKAWTQLRIGSMQFYARDFAAALTTFRTVTDTMGNCPEKSLAMLNAAVCYTYLNNLVDAKSSYQSCLSMPDMCFSDRYQSLWAPLNSDIDKPFPEDGTIHEIAARRLSSLAAGSP